MRTALGWFNAKSVLQSFHGGDVVGRGTDATDARYNDRHLLGRGALHKVVKASELGGLKTRRKDRGSTEVDHGLGMSLYPTQGYSQGWH